VLLHPAQRSPDILHILKIIDADEDPVSRSAAFVRSENFRGTPERIIQRLRGTNPGDLSR
jgi:hypothetical protein